MIIVKPNGGLGNRMRVINSALYLARQNKKESIIVLWKKDAGLNVRFNDIFQPIAHTFTTGNMLLMSYYFYSRKLLPLRYRYYDDQSISDNRFDTTYWDQNHRKVILNTCFDFYELNAQTNFYHLFQPVEKLQKKIGEISKDFDEATVGVHIRRTDNVPSTEKSKTGDFIRRMEELVEEKSGTNFYVATDDPGTESKLKQHFGDRIRSMSNKHLDRNSGVGIEDAATDMYCLSRTSLILGSFSSSFSAVASGIGKIPLEIIAQEKIK
jgi:hypothetical protein